MGKIRILVIIMFVGMICACSKNDLNSETSEIPNKTNSTNQSEEDNRVGIDEEVLTEETTTDTQSNTIDDQSDNISIDVNIDPEIVKAIHAHINAVNEGNKEALIKTLDAQEEHNERQWVLWNYTEENDTEFQITEMSFYGSNWDNQVVISIYFQSDMNGSVALWKREDGWKIDNFDVSLTY